MAASRTAATVLRGRMTSSSPSASPLAFATVITPRGALSLERTETAVPLEDAVAARLEAAFARGAGHGLLQLGLAEAGRGCPPISPSGAPLRDAVRRGPLPRGGDRRVGAEWRGTHPLGPRSAADAGRRISRRRPRSRAVAGARDAFESELAASGAASTPFSPRATAAGGMSGRVHFHLAENRKDAERPFAFLATYAPGSPPTARSAMPRSARRCASTPARAAKAELLKLLEPVSRASESCAWLKEIVDSGEIFHPLRWTPSEAMRLLEDVARWSRRASSCGCRPAGRAPARAGRRSRRPSARRRRRWSAPMQLLDFAVEVTLDGETLIARGDRAAPGRDRRPGDAARKMGRGRSREAQSRARPLRRDRAARAEGRDLLRQGDAALGRRRHRRARRAARRRRLGRRKSGRLARGNARRLPPPGGARRGGASPAR